MMMKADNGSVSTVALIQICIWNVLLNDQTNSIPFVIVILHLDVTRTVSTGAFTETSHYPFAAETRLTEECRLKTNRVMNYLCGKDCPCGESCTNLSLSNAVQKSCKIVWVSLLWTVIQSPFQSSCTNFFRGIFCFFI